MEGKRVSQMLNDRQLTRFFRDGYLHVPASRIQVAAEVQQGLLELCRTVGPRKGQQEKQFDDHPSILQLHEHLLPWAHELVGAHAPRVLSQLAVLGATADFDVAHIDGRGRFDRGGSLDDLPRFKLLVGYYPAAIEECNRGNFCVFPGGHGLVERFFSNYGVPQERSEQKRLFDALWRQLAALEYEQLLVDAGDVVFVHSLLPHTVAPNTGADRLAIYLRFGNYSETGMPALSDAWHSWPEWTNDLI